MTGADYAELGIDDPILRQWADWTATLPTDHGRCDECGDETGECGCDG